MILKVKTNITCLIQGVRKCLLPFAEANQVEFLFVSSNEEIEANCRPNEVINNLTTLLCRIITYTPQTHKVILSLSREQTSSENIIINIHNTGVNLGVFPEIIRDLSFPVHCSKHQEAATTFFMNIPTEKALKGSDGVPFGQNKGYIIKPFYSEVRKRLNSHFKNIHNLEVLAEQKGEKEGIFLKKINAIIFSQLDHENFGVNELASRMAISRVQLFRKIKALTQVSPHQYIMNIRLQKARELLEREDCNVSEAAYRAGFISASHFTRAFQKKFGFKPSILKSKHTPM